MLKKWYKKYILTKKRGLTVSQLLISGRISPIISECNMCVAIKVREQ